MTARILCTARSVHWCRRAAPERRAATRSRRGRAAEADRCPSMPAHERRGRLPADAVRRARGAGAADRRRRPGRRGRRRRPARRRARGEPARAWRSSTHVRGQRVLDAERPAGDSDVDDVRGLLDRTAATGCFDADRISITGVSNGAGFSARMACELPGRFVAVVPVAAGYRALDPCPAAARTNFLAIHGTGDTVVPYNGKKPDRKGSVPRYTAALGAPRRLRIAPGDDAAPARHPLHVARPRRRPARRARPSDRHPARLARLDRRAAAREPLGLPRDAGADPVRERRAQALIARILARPPGTPGGRSFHREGHGCHEHQRRTRRQREEGRGEGRRQARAG